MHALICSDLLTQMYCTHDVIMLAHYVSVRLRLRQPSICLQVSERLKVPVSEVKNVIIWGNHSSTQYPDVNHGTVQGTPIRKAIDDDSYLDGDFIQVVQQRGAAIIKVLPHQFPTPVCRCDSLKLCSLVGVPSKMGQCAAVDHNLGAGLSSCCRPVGQYSMPHQECPPHKTPRGVSHQLSARPVCTA